MNLYCNLYRGSASDSLLIRGYFLYKVGETETKIGKRTKPGKIIKTILPEEYLNVWSFRDCILTDKQLHKKLEHVREVDTYGGDEWFRFYSISMNIDCAIEELCNQLDILTGKNEWRRQNYAFGTNRETPVPIDKRMIPPKKGSKKRAEEESKTLGRRINMIKARKK